MTTWIVLIGQHRAAKETLPTFLRHVFGPLRAKLLIVRIDDGFADDSPYHETADHVLRLPPWGDYADWLDSIAGNSSWRGPLMRYRGNWLGGASGDHWYNGARILYMRHCAAQWLNANTNANSRYIVTRPDFYYLADHPPLRLLDSQAAWVTDGVQWRGVKDHYALLGKHDLAAYMGIAELLVASPHLLATHIPRTDQYRDENYLSIERFQKLCFDLAGLTPRIKLFPEIGFIARTKSDPVGSSAGVLYRDGIFAKFAHEVSSACRTAEWVRRRGWESVLAETCRPFSA